MNYKYEYFLHFCGVSASYTVRGLLGTMSSCLNIMLCTLGLLYEDVIRQFVTQSGRDKSLATHCLIKFIFGVFWLGIFVSSVHLIVSFCLISGCYEFIKNLCLAKQKKPEETVETKSSAALLKPSAPLALPAPAGILNV